MSTIGAFQRVSGRGKAQRCSPESGSSCLLLGIRRGSPFLSDLPRGGHSVGGHGKGRWLSLNQPLRLQPLKILRPPMEKGSILDGSLFRPTHSKSHYSRPRGTTAITPVVWIALAPASAHSCTTASLRQKQWPRSCPMGCLPPGRAALSPP